MKKETSDAQLQRLSSGWEKGSAFLLRWSWFLVLVSSSALFAMSVNQPQLPSPCSPKQTGRHAVTRPPRLSSRVCNWRRWHKCRCAAVSGIRLADAAIRSPLGTHFYCCLLFVDCLFLIVTTRLTSSLDGEEEKKKVTHILRLVHNSCVSVHSQPPREIILSLSLSPVGSRSSLEQRIVPDSCDAGWRKQKQQQ